MEMIIYNGENWPSKASLTATLILSASLTFVVNLFTILVAVGANCWNSLAHLTFKSLKNGYAIKTKKTKFTKPDPVYSSLY